MAAIQHFILVFDHAKGHLICDPLDFGHDSKSAVARYSALEHEYRESTNMDIVLVGSDSLETVKVTHANYFDGTAAFSKYLRKMELQPSQ
ncbi:hypothetical protein [Homoserinimonas sp. OAct 916]|uniref:hypothetical protein n=1 Tax=Homoserinimonas sp. OAct 916 TaxID=2211450 RepID=UPI000DBE3083|nr:hypothetical protein [Homoserinimonas sp. OAct 916]